MPVWFTPSARRAWPLLFPGRRGAQHFVERGHALGDLHRAREAQRPKPVLQRLGSQLALVAGRLDEVAGGIADREQLEQARPAAKAGHAAFEAPDRLVGPDAAV